MKFIHAITDATRKKYPRRLPKPIPLYVETFASFARHGIQWILISILVRSSRTINPHLFQDIPLHTTTLTFLLIFWDRYRYVRRPTKPRLPAFVCIVGTWLTSVCLVLPYPIYIMYVDLGVSSYYKVNMFFEKFNCVELLANS